MAEKILNIEQGGDPLGILNSKKAITSNIRDTDPLGILKKKVGGAISYLTELPSEFIEPLKKGVEPPKPKELISSGLIIPTNLPKQDEMRYERELKTQDAAINTLTDIYKQKGLKFDSSRPAAQKQIQDYIDQEKTNDLVRVPGKDGKEYLTRGQGFIEAGAKALAHSVIEPFKSAEINFTNTPSELADLLDKKIAEEPNVPESAPTKVGGYMGGLIGGLPKLMGLLAIPYFGEAAMVTEMYHNAVASERRVLYERGIRSKENGGEGLDREAAAKMAMETAPVTAIPDAAMGLVLARGVGGKSILPEAEKKAFRDALAPFKGVAKVAGLGGVAGSSKSLLALASGYDVTATEVLESGGRSMGEYALMDGAFKLMHKAGTIANVGLRASKAVVSAAKNLLSSVPKEILEVQAEKYPDGKDIVQKVEEFAKVKDEVKDLVPAEKVGSVTGLTQKIKTIQADMDELTARREKTTDALKPQIDEWLKEYQDEIDFYNNQIKKVVKSKDPSGISEEIDDVTGEKIGAKKYTVDGEEVSQEAFEALQGKPIGTKEIIEVKPVETYEDKVKQILMNQMKAEGYRYMGAPSDLAKIPIEDVKSDVSEALKSFIKTTDGLPIRTVYRLRAEFEAKGYGDIPDGTKLEDIKDKIDSLKPSKRRSLEDDIYRKREEELDSLSYLPMTIKDDMTAADKKRVQDRREDIKKINDKYDAELAAVEVKEDVEPTEDVNKVNVTIEGTADGYKVISGDKANSIGDIRQEANEARAKGQDTFTTETIKDGKKIFTLTDTTVSDEFGRPGFKSASMSFPEGTKVTMEDVMAKLKLELGVKEEVKPIEENKLKQYNRKGTITPDVINLKYDDNGKEVGGMTLGKYKNYLTLDHIYFSPEYRGTGLSKYAYKDALEIAKNQGYEGLMVGGQLTTEYKTKETYKNFATKELDIKNEKGNPYILLTDWIGKENIEETPEIRLMSPEEVKPTEVSPKADIEKRREEEFIKRAKKVSKSAKNIIESVENGKSQVFTNVLDAAKDVLSNLQAPIGGNKSYFEYLQKQVNAEFDAELAALKEVKPTEVKGSGGVGGDVIFQGKRGQADSITFDGKTIKQGEEIELNDVNISQDDSMPDLRSGKYKVRMLSVDANGKTATLTLTDGNEVITTTVKDLRKSEQSLKETTKEEVKPTEVKEEITIEEEPTQSDIAKQQTIETDLLIGGQAAQRRKDNKYTKDGVEYIRNSKGNGVPSSVTGDVRFTNEVSLPFKYKLIEAKDLQPSHQDGIRNPNHFIPEAQPKNRNDAGSLMAENSFSSKPRFEELGENTNAYSGAPIVNERGEVVQGNNRAAGLRKGYDAKNQQYKNDLANNSSQFGFTKEQVEKMNEPILVREVAVSDEGAIEVGNYDVKDLETGGKRRLDPIAITRRMPFDIKGRIAEMLFTGEETLNQAIRANQKRVLELLNPYLNQAQRNTITKEGILTDVGVKDLEDVVKQFLFDNGDTALPDLFENLSANQKEGLKKSLPYIFSTSPDKSIVPDIQEAILAVADFRDSGAGDFNAWLAQGDMFADGKTPRDKYTPLEIEIAKTLIEAKTQKEIVKKFGDYSDIVKDKEANMFDPAIAGKTRAEGIKEIFKTEDYAKPISERGGKTPTRKEELAAEPSLKPRNTEKVAGKEVEKIAATVEDLLALDPKDKTTLKKISNTLDQVLSDLNNFEKENLGVNIALPIMKTIIKAIKALVDIGVSLEEAIKRVSAENNVEPNDVVDGLNAISKVAIKNDKPTQNAIQEQSAKEKVPRAISTGENITEGGERVRPSKQRTKITEKGGIEGYEKVNDFLYKGPDETRKMSLLKRLVEAEDIPKSYKDALSSKGLDYKVSNQVEASNVAKSMVDELGIYDALDIARKNMIDPSVGSAIFGNAIDKLYSDEITLRSQGRIEEADALAQQWADTSFEYAKIANSGGKWNAQIAYFYKTSPMGFVMRVNNEKAEQFKEWFANKEDGYKEVFDEIIKSKEGQKLLLEEVENITKSQRQVERKKRDKSIDDFFEKAKLKSNVAYATIIPPQVWNGAMEVMKASVKAGDRVVVAIQRAIEHIDKNLGGKEWDKDKFKKDYEFQLSKVTEEKADVDVLGDKIKGLEKQIEDYKKRILEGGALKQKPSEKFADNEEVQSLKKEREALQKENQDLLKQKKEGRYSDEAKISQSEKRILKNIDELEKRIEDNDLEIEKPETLNSPKLEELRSKQKKLREELETRRKAAGIGRFSEDAKYEDKEKRNKNRIAELNRRMEQGDFSSETYKAKKEKDKLDKELDAVREQYNEAKKKSPEYIDKQAKQYLDKFRSKLKGLNQDQQEAIIKKSIKKLTESGALEYDDFKAIVSETLGIKSLTPDQVKRIEKLTKETNISDDTEQAFLDAPSRETIDAYKLAKQNSLEADKELFELTYSNADVTGTLKSIVTLNLMGAGTIVKNYGSNILYQGFVRFPKALITRGIDKTIYGSSLMLNKFTGVKVAKQELNLTDAQLGYFKEYNEGLVRGMDQLIKGVDEKDYFGTSQYTSRLNPRKSLNDIKAALKGDIFLTNAQKWDKGIQATLGWQPYAVSRLMIYGDKPPRYAAQGAMAMQIGHNELGITNPLEMEAFMVAPQKYAYNHLMKVGEMKGKSGEFEKMTSDEASKISKDIHNRIIDAGAVAVFQNENYVSTINNFIDKSLAVTKESPMVVKIFSPPLALLKATQLPFVKTPANIIWSYVKLANPAFTAAKALGEVSYAKYLFSKGDVVGAKKYENKSKDSMATAIWGMAISAAAITFASQGLIRTKSSDKDTQRETAGESFFGKDNELNIGKMTGAGDFWVDLSWFPGVGAILDTQARIIEDNKAKALKGEKVDEYFLGYDILSTLEYSFSSSLNTLVLDQGAKVVNAIRSGEKAAQNWSITTLNTVSNFFTGGTFSTFSRAMLPEKPSTKADSMWERIKNEQKTRNAVVRLFAGRPPSKISMWGEPIKNNNSILGVIGSFLGYEAGSNNKFGAILYEDAQRTGNDKFFPALEDYKIKVNGKDQKLTEEQKSKLDTYIGQARKNYAAPYVYDMAKLPEYDAKYSDLSDQDKIDALDVIYSMGKDAGFAKFKEEYKQFQDAEINVEEIIKKAEQSIKKTLFKVSLMQKSNQ